VSEQNTTVVARPAGYRTEFGSQTVTLTYHHDLLSLPNLLMLSLRHR